ncbi:MAG: integrase core domain-containing protein [Simkaniaceae bacterium]|nr:integrase core domain-containing protein [Candidatus Sacchlamyda saccharinae]
MLEHENRRLKAMIGDLTIELKKRRGVTMTRFPSLKVIEITEPKALEEGICKQFPNGVREARLELASDNGFQPTSTKSMQTCHHLGLEQIFTIYNNPKGNAETERMVRTLKEELIWLREWTSHHEVEKAAKEWVKSYNESSLHSAHGYRSLVWAEKNYKKQEAP